MKKLSTYPWRRIYVAAILETNEAEVAGRIYEAIAAMDQRRLQPLSIDDDESRALANADVGFKA
jgi:hypothetical protein